MLDALPVVVDLASPVDDEVRRFVGALGWQIVAAGESLVSPRLRLVDVDAVTAGHVRPRGTADRRREGGDPSVTVRAALSATHRTRRSSNDPVPTVLVVPEDAPPGRAAGAALARGVAAVVAWPGERDRLAAVAADLVERRPDEPARQADEVRVAGAAGGVGATTVALTLAGLHAWRGARTLALTRGDTPVPDTPRIDEPDLTGALLWHRAAAAPGLARLRVARCDPSTPDAPVDAGGADLLVREVGVVDDADVLVARRDAAGVQAVAATTAGACVVVEIGVAPHAALVAASGGRLLVTVPWSVRVARSGLRRRTPGSLPGTWVRALRPLVGRPQAEPTARAGGVAPT